MSSSRGAHGCHAALSAHASFGERMYAMLATTSPHTELPMLDMDDLTDTLTLKATLDGPESDKWMTAIHAELQNIKARMSMSSLLLPVNQLIT